MLFIILTNPITDDDIVIAIDMVKLITSYTLPPKLKGLGELKKEIAGSVVTLKDNTEVHVKESQREIYELLK